MEHEKIQIVADDLDSWKAASTVDDLDSWKNSSANKNTTLLGYSIVVDIDGMEMLAPFVTGFMIFPIGAFNGKILESRTLRVDRIQEFKQYIIDSNNQIFLYQLHWVPSYPYYKELDAKTSEPTILADGPYIKSGFWLVRYAEIGK